MAVPLPNSTSFTAVVLAGIRPGGDPLAAAHGVPRKALLRIGEAPMIARVLAALRAAGAVDRIAICGVDRQTLEAGGVATAVLEEVLWLEAAANPSESVVAALDRLGGDVPVLVTTADHPLLTAEIVDTFCASATGAGGDVVAAVVDADTVRASFPDALRTFYRLRDGAFTGCNLFAFLGRGGRRAAEAWRFVERHRKKPWRVVSLLGPWTLLRFAFHRLSIDDAAELLSGRLGVRARVVRLPFAEAGIDVDKPADVELVERILASRRTSSAGSD